MKLNKIAVIILISLFSSLISAQATDYKKEGM